MYCVVTYGYILELAPLLLFMYPMSFGINYYIQKKNTFAPIYHNTLLAQCYHWNNLEKKRVYDHRVRETEHGSFSPLVFSTTGGIGMTAKRLASLIAEKYKKPYSKTMQWI